MKLIKKMEKLTEGYVDKAVLWILSNKFRVALFVLVSLFLILILPLPYVNLFLTKKLVIFLIIVSLFVIFKIDWRKIIYIVFLLFLFIFLLTLLKENETVSTLGNYIYGFLLVALISYFWDI